MMADYPGAVAPLALPAPPAAEPVDSYRIKRVRFLGREVPIFMQNLNGPCPLLAIANILSLRNQLNVPLGWTTISTSRLISAIAERIIDSNTTTAAPSYAASSYEQNLRQNVSDCLEVLGKLATGIDVNVRFNSIHGFEPTKEVRHGPRRPPCARGAEGVVGSCAGLDDPRCMAYMACVVHAASQGRGVWACARGAVR